MKVLAMLLLCASMPGFSQAETQLTLQQKFEAMQSQAPNGFPTLFVVSTSSVSPSTFLGADGGCSMNLETFGKVYFVETPSGMFKDCKAFQPGTILWGHVHRILGTVVDVLDSTEGKPKSRRYIVQNISLVNPETQQ
jgi:hypothetical protein